MCGNNTIECIFVNGVFMSKVDIQKRIDFMEERVFDERDYGANGLYLRAKENFQKDINLFKEYLVNWNSLEKYYMEVK